MAEQETFFDNYFASEGLVPAEPSRRGQPPAPQSFHAKHRCSHIEGYDSAEQCASLRASHGGRLHFAEGRPPAEQASCSGD